jgi:hypothetical protein
VFCCQRPDAASARYGGVLCRVSDFPFAFTEDLQPGGINHQVRDLPRVTVLKLTLTDFARLLTLVIRAAQRNVHQGENGINEALSSPQGQPEYAFNHQNGSDGRSE